MHAHAGAGCRRFNEMVALQTALKSGVYMGSLDDTRMIGEAWAQATSLSADGQLQKAIMGFLGLRCGSNTPPFL